MGKARKRGSAGTERRGGLSTVSLISVLRESQRQACAVLGHANKRQGPPCPPLASH